MLSGSAIRQTSASSTKVISLASSRRSSIASPARDEKLDPHLARNFISKAKNSGWTARDREMLTGAVYLRYEQELRALNAMDFDEFALG
jgi:superfamily I DNA/RNA helicase